MAAVSLFWNTNKAAVTSCEYALYWALRFLWSFVSSRLPQALILTQTYFDALYFDCIPARAGSVGS